MSAAAVIPSLVPLIVAVAMRRAEAELHRQLVEAGALTAETAIPLTPRRSIGRSRLESLIRGGAVHRTATGHHFLDVKGWSRHQQNRRRRVLLALSVVVALIGVTVGVLSIMR